MRAAGAVSSFAPRGAEDLDWLAGMVPQNRAEFAAAEAGEEPLRAFIERLLPSFTELDAEGPGEALDDLLSPLDRSLLNGDYAEHGAVMMRAALRDGIWGWLDDDLALVADWGVELTAIRVPVTIWHGDDDRMVPFDHGRWLAGRVPAAAARLLAGEGHLSIEVGRYGEILDDLLRRGS